MTVGAGVESGSSCFGPLSTTMVPYEKAGPMGRGQMPGRRDRPPREYLGKLVLGLKSDG